MGFFKKLGNAISKPFKSVAKGAVKLVTDPGDWAQNIGKQAGKGISAVSSFLPPGLAQAAAVGGSLLQGNNRNEHLGALARSALGGIAGKIPGLDKLTDFGSRISAGAGKGVGSLASKALGKNVGDFVGRNVTGQVNSLASRALAPFGSFGGPGGGGAGGMTSTGGFGGGPPIIVNGRVMNQGGGGGGYGGSSGGSMGGGSAGPPASGSRYGAVGDLARRALSGGKPLTLGNIIGSGGGAIGDAVKGVGSFARDNADVLLAGGAGVLGAMDMKKAGDLRDAALSRSRGAWDARAPLREMALSGLMSDERPNLSGVYRDPTNPFDSAGSSPGTPAPPVAAVPGSAARTGIRPAARPPAPSEPAVASKPATGIAALGGQLRKKALRRVA